MQTFLLSLVIVVASVAGLAVGVLFKREPLRGSCGGASCTKAGGCACRPDEAGQPP